MMRRDTTILIIILLSIIFAASLTVSFYLYSPKKMDSNIITPSTPPSPTNYSSDLLGSTDYGYVVKEGPYGNISSNIKIAYIVGVHPQESNAHTAAVESIKIRNSTLKHCYYIYKVNVTKDGDDYTKGRNNGQLLANKYVLPDAVKEKFRLAIDVHSNVGNWAENTFIFAPVKESSSESIGMEISRKINWLTYYVPPNPTSPEYLTIPLINSGIPSVIYETYSKESYQTTRDRTDEFIKTVDELDNL